MGEAQKKAKAKPKRSIQKYAQQHKPIMCHKHLNPKALTTLLQSQQCWSIEE